MNRLLNRKITPYTLCSTNMFYLLALFSSNVLFNVCRSIKEQSAVMKSTSPWLNKLCLCLCVYFLTQHDPTSCVCVYVYISWHSMTQQAVCVFMCIFLNTAWLNKLCFLFKYFLANCSYLLNGTIWKLSTVFQHSLPPLVSDVLTLIRFSITEMSEC